MTSTTAIRCSCTATALIALVGSAAYVAAAPHASAEPLRDTTHYSPATQIDAGNVAKLGVAWEFRDFVVRGRTQRGVEATPVYHHGTLYMIGPWNVVYALDARSGRERWRYDPGVDGSFARRTCCDVVSRGVAVEGDRVYLATLDGYLIALDARSGRPVWRTDTITDRSRSYAITGAPRVAGRNVVIGNGGGEMGVRGYVTALDKRTGRLAWRFYIVPGDPKAGPDEHPEVTQARATWDPDSAWNLGGGGTAWDSIVYDPETDIVYVGTGNGSPHPIWQRSPKGGDNLYLSSILALDARTGRKRWHYQTTPGDSWDFTATQNMILTDLTLGGRVRKVIMQAPKNGFFYVLDRVTGELLSAEKYVTVTWADRVDLATGRPVFTGQGDFSTQRKLVWPGEAGGHNWMPMAYSARTGLVYIPTIETPMIFQVQPMPYRPYSVVQGNSAEIPALAGPAVADDPALRGQPTPRFEQVLRAWDPVRARVVWSSAPLPFWSGGVLVTGGDLVLMGDAEGFLNVYDARSGARLHRIEIGTGILAAPMSYRIGTDQYVAVAAGFGGAFNSYFPAGYAAAKRENGSRLLVFRLGGRAPALPRERSPVQLAPSPAEFRGTAQQVAHGEQLFIAHCAACHGAPDTVSGYPNLWALNEGTHRAFETIVLGGVYAYAGMASFADVLSADDVRDLHTFLAEPFPAAAPAASPGQPAQSAPPGVAAVR